MRSLLGTPTPSRRPRIRRPAHARAWFAPSALGLVALCMSGIAVSCGGKAVVDGEPDDGAGGTGAGGGSGAGGSTICSTPPPVGMVYICGGAATETGCFLESCDESGQRWRATCSATGCSCEHAPSGTVCSCVGGDANSFCSGTSRSCCPTPFP